MDLRKHKIVNGLGPPLTPSTSALYRRDALTPETKTSKPSIVSGILHGLGLGGTLYSSLVLMHLTTMPFAYLYKPGVRYIFVNFTRRFVIPTCVRLGGLRVTGSGLEHIDACPNGYVLIANHASNIDPIALLYLMDRTDLNFVAKVETLRRPMLGKLLQSIPWLAVDRASLASLKKLAQEVREKQSKGWIPRIVVFPEGTRSEDGKLGAFKSGPFLLAALLGIPIIPVIIRGTFPLHKKDAFLVYPGPVDVEVCKPIWPTKLEGKQLDLKVVDAAGKLMKEAVDLYKSIDDFTVVRGASAAPTESHHA
jgi:1-acyl-sn-glycerol-3-phosphate acyltransferase